MKNPLTILIPSYAEDFKCIGGECEDSCCIGWNVDIDKKTYRKYFQTKNAKMKEKFKNHIYKNKESSNKDVDYGRIVIGDTKWCPYLEEDKLCEIQRNLGEDYLSNVCYSFPRVYNILNGTYELSLAMSCPEAVRKLLSKREAIKFTERNMIQTKHTIHGSIDTNNKYWKNTPIQQLTELRSLSIEIIQNRSFPLNKRLLYLGNRLEKIAQGESICENPIGIKNKYTFQLEFFRYVIESLGVIDKNDSPVFEEHTGLLAEQFALLENTPPIEKTALYNKVIETLLKPFTEENSYIFEHYLVNFIYQENFPFSESQDMFDGYVMLVVRYALVQLYLTGIAAKNKTLTIDDVALMIQVHTKIINHHKTFVPNLLQEIKRKGFDKMIFISQLLN